MMVDDLIDLLKAIYDVKLEFIQILETDELDFDQYPTLITNYLVDKYNEGYIAGYDAGWKHFFPDEDTEMNPVLEHVEYTPESYNYSGDYDYDELVDLMKDARDIRYRIKSVLNTEDNFWPNYPDILLALAQERYQDGFDAGYALGYSDGEQVYVFPPTVSCFNNIVTITPAVEGDTTTYYAIAYQWVSDGDEENLDYSIYTEPIEIYDDCQVFTYTVRGNRQSPIEEQLCNYVSILAPVITNYYGEVTITAEEGTTIYFWITSGEDELQPLTTYSSPFLISQTCVVHSYCTLHSQTSSENSVLCEYEEVHVEAPIIITGNEWIFMKCATEGVAIRYTLDGSLPTRSSTLYTGRVQCTEWTSYTIKAIAYKGASSSEITTATHSYYDSDHNHLTYRAVGGSATVYIGHQMNGSVISNTNNYVNYSVLSDTNPRKFAYKGNQSSDRTNYDVYTTDPYFDDHDPWVVELQPNEELVLKWFPYNGLAKTLNSNGRTGHEYDYTSFENEANLRCYGSIYESAISYSGITFSGIGRIDRAFLVPNLSGKNITMYRRPDCVINPSELSGSFYISSDWGYSSSGTILTPWKITDTIKWAKDRDIDRDFGPNSGRSKYYNFTDQGCFNYFYAVGDSLDEYHSNWSNGTWLGENSRLVNINDNALPEDESIGLQDVFLGCTGITDASRITINELTLTFQCKEMFKQCTHLLVPPTLSANILTYDCYRRMFDGCIRLVNAPALPSTNIAPECYWGMFWGCTSIITAPALPATTLVTNCYANMFNGCTSLINAPVLRATALQNGCYSSMFNGCTNINRIICFGMSNILGDATGLWLNNTASTGEFIGFIDANWLTESVSGIPSGWTRKDLIYTEDGKSAQYRSESANSFTIRFFCAYDNWTATGSESWIGIPNYIGGYGWHDLTVNLTGTNDVRNGYIYIVNGSQAGLNSGITRLKIMVEQNNEFFNPLTFTVISTGKIGWFSYGRNGGSSGSLSRTISYKINDGTWNNIQSRNWDEGAITFNVSAGDVVQFKGNNNSYGAADGVGCTFVYQSGTKVAISGNVMSLIDGANFTSIDTVSDYCFQWLFDGLGLGTYKCIVNCDGLVLPATKLGQYCYAHMFSKAADVISYRTNLLPADVLAPYCYYCMFEDNGAMTSAPALPATILSEHCYDNMFSKCRSLTTAPDLVADRLVEGCYSNMFFDSDSLNYIKCYGTKYYNSSNINTNVYYDILGRLNNPQSRGTFYKKRYTSWSVGEHYIPSTWTQVDFD